MRKGQRVRITSLIAPQGREMESLRIERERGIVGTIEMEVEPDGWFAVQFPTCEKPLHVHRSMMEYARA